MWHRKSYVCIHIHVNRLNQNCLLELMLLTWWVMKGQTDMSDAGIWWVDWPSDVWVHGYHFRHILVPLSAPATYGIWWVYWESRTDQNVNMVIYNKSIGRVKNWPKSWHGGILWVNWPSEHLTLARMPFLAFQHHYQSLLRVGYDACDTDQKVQYDECTTDHLTHVSRTRLRSRLASSLLPTSHQGPVPFYFDCENMHFFWIKLPVVNSKDLFYFCRSDPPGQMTPVTAGSGTLSRLNSHASLDPGTMSVKRALCVCWALSYGASEAQTAITPRITLPPLDMTHPTTNSLSGGLHPRHLWAFSQKVW